MSERGSDRWLAEAERIAEQLYYHEVTTPTGEEAILQLCATVEQATREEMRRELFDELVVCSLRDPDHVIHRPRLDCQHEAPHLIAACGAFKAQARDIPAAGEEL